MGGVAAATRRAALIIVVWAYLATFTSGQLQHQQQWQQKYAGTLAAGPHLRGGQHSSKVGRQLEDTSFSSLGQQDRQSGQQRHTNKRIINGRQLGVANQGLLSGVNQLGLQPYNNLNLVTIPKDVLPDPVPLIPIIPVRPVSPTNALPGAVPVVLQQTGLLGGQNSGQPGGYNPALSSGQNSGPSRLTNQIGSTRPLQSSTRPQQSSSRPQQSSSRPQQSFTRPLQPSQTSLQSAPRTPLRPSSIRSPTSNRKVESTPRRAQPSFGGQPDIAIIEDIRDGPHSDGSYYFKYGQTDGTVREEGGEPRGPCELRVTGNYYYQAPNGEIIHREYVADGLGHREFPAGTRPDIYDPPRRVPVAPPMMAGGMPPCDDGQYRPMGDDGQYRPTGNNGQWRPQATNVNRPPPPPQQPQKPRPPPQQPQKPRPPPQQPQRPRPPPQQPQRPRPPPQQPQRPIPPPQQPQPYNPPARPQPQPQPYIPQTQPQIVNPAPAPQPPKPSPQIPSPGYDYLPPSGNKLIPGTGLSSGQNSGLTPSILNINTQNNDNTQWDGANVLNFNTQNNSG